MSDIVVARHLGVRDDSTMNWMVLVCLAATPVLAGPRKSEPAVRKATPTGDKFLKAAGEAFAKARAADEAGDLGEALRLYEKAQAISPHPNTIYNIADIERRMTNIRLAIEKYREYLALDPKASDHAAVEKLIDALEHMPGTLTIDLEDPESSQVFVDGMAYKGATIDVQHGDHVVDAISAISADSTSCQIDQGITGWCRLRLPPRVDGNVFLSGPSDHVYRTTVSNKGFRYQIKTRFTLEPKHYEITLNDRQCKPVGFDVAKGDVVTYVWFDYPKDKPPRDKCVNVSVKQRTLKF